MLRVAIAVMGAGLAWSVWAAESATDLKEPKQKDSYSLGYRFGDNLRKQSVELDIDLLSQGLREGFSGQAARLSPQEMQESVKHLQQQALASQQKKSQEQAAKNLAAGNAFLAENAKKEGVKTLPSGLQYKVLSEGSGKSPKADDTVKVNYRGTLIDGTEFDSSDKRNEPAVFRVNGVIPGWTEALQLMKEGGKWQLFIPPNLAYGERGMRPVIPPNSVLVFEVELLSIQPQGKGPGEAAGSKTP